MFPLLDLHQLFFFFFFSFTSTLVLMLGFKLENIINHRLHQNHHSNVLSLQDIKLLRKARNMRRSEAEGWEAAAMYFWQLCSTSELTNYSSKSIQLLLFSYGHRKLQITSLYSERTAMTGITIQEIVDFGDGDFYRELLSKTIIKTWSELAKLAAKHLRFMNWPCWLPAAGSPCFHILTPNTHFPSGNLQPEPGQMSRSWINLPEFTVRNYVLFHDCTDLQHWKKNDLKPFE